MAWPKSILSGNCMFCTPNIILRVVSALTKYSLLSALTCCLVLLYPVIAGKLTGEEVIKACVAVGREST